MKNIPRIARVPVLALIGTMLTLSFALAAVPAQGPAHPPAARIAPVVDDYYGTQVTDPYRWMEAPDNAELRDWMKAQSDHTAATLEKIPGRAQLLARIRELDRATSSVYQITPVGQRYFYFRMNPGEPVPKVYVRDGLAGKERLLIDPTHGATKEEHAEVGWFEPSKDGRYVAFGMALGGAEWGELRVVAADTGKTLSEKITRIWAGDGASASWLPDNKSFSYLRFPKLAPGQRPQDKQLRSRVYLHILGRNVGGDGDKAIFGFDVDPTIKISEEAFSFVAVLPGSTYAVADTQTVDVDYGEIYVAPISELTGPSLHWKRIATHDDHISAGPRLVAHDNALYLLSHKNAPRFQVLRFDMSAPDVSHASVVVPESKLVIEDIAAAQDALYIQGLDGGLSNLQRLPWSGASAATPVALPFAGAIQHTSTSPDRPGALLRMRSWNHPNEILHVDPQAQSVKNTGWQEAPAVDFSGIEALEVNAVSYDGTLVPLSILIRKDAKRDGIRPTLLDSYGAYGTYGTTLPFFDAKSLAWLERGGVLAFAHPRGGGEFGEEWHRGGMKQTKLNSVFDTLACAQYLLDEHYATPATLALSGASAGGIVVGGGITWRPYMFAAAIDHAGVTDTLRFETTTNGPDNIPEFGSVKTEEGFRALHAMSPYANVREGVSYPAVLLETGINDPRVESWIIGKMAARLQAATASDKPVLLRVDFDTGHFGGTSDQADQLLADEWSFLLWQFGDPAFQPPIH